MKNILLISLLLLSISGVLHAQYTTQPAPAPEPQPAEQENPCDPEKCATCSQNYLICAKCKKDYVFSTRTNLCVSREEYEDRGDAVSIVVAVLNIIFVVFVTGLWMWYSRTNNATYKNIAEQDIELASPEKTNNLFNTPEQVIRIGAPSEKTSQYDAQSMRSSQVKPDPMTMPGNNNIEGLEADYKQQPNQPGIIANDNNNQMNNMNQNIINNNNQLISSSPPSPGTANGISNQTNNHGVTTNNLNGYWMTQAGKFSFQSFSNLHRIKHVMMNFFILEVIIAQMMTMSQRRGDDEDTDERKKLLFIAFAVCMVIYWGITLIPSIVMKILSCCACLKNDPNGRCSNITVWVLFLVPSVLMTVATTRKLLLMDGFETQVWILLVLAGLLVIVFSDKKSIELAKRWKGGRFSRIIKFRKIDFETTPPTLQM